MDKENVTHIHTQMEYISVIRGLFTTKCMQLENIMLSEITDTER